MGCANAGRSKLHYAASLAAALAHLALRQRDAVGLTLFADAVLAHLPPRAKAEPARRGPRDDRRRRGPPGRRQRPGRCTRRPSLPAGAGLVVLISDLFGDLPAIVGGLDHLRYRNHEVILFQILDPFERDLSRRRQHPVPRPGERRGADHPGRGRPRGLPEGRRRLAAGARGRVPQAGDRPDRADHDRPARPGPARLPGEAGEDVLNRRGARPMNPSLSLPLIVVLLAQAPPTGPDRWSTPAARLDFMKKSLADLRRPPGRRPGRPRIASRPSRSSGSRTRVGPVRDGAIFLWLGETTGRRSRPRSS